MIPNGFNGFSDNWHRFKEKFLNDYIVILIDCKSHGNIILNITHQQEIEMT